MLTAICLLLLVGARGKSAQIPLYVWLPDAMAGPTPVSALIHAATMVTAGVYMVGALGRVYSRTPDAMNVVAIIGLATAFMAATIGLVAERHQESLRVLDCLAARLHVPGIGVGAFSAGIFHVVTHAFFKALLFLGAGRVIHALARRAGHAEHGRPAQEDSDHVLDA